MGQEYTSPATADVTLVTTTETVVATVAGVITPGPGRKVQLRGYAQVTTGTNTTGIIFRWRKGTAITDTLVGEANTVQVSAAAGSTEDHNHETEDTPGELTGQSYVFTVQLVAASANGAVVQAYGSAKVIP